MKNLFFRTIEEAYGGKRDLFVLTADLGFKLFDPLQKKLPGRFFDVGVAEANMVGISAGLSLSGMQVYCYSIIPFLAMRASEQIRVDIAYHDLPVKLVGAGRGFTYGLEGYTHYGIEDLAAMRALPNITIVTPGDFEETKALALQSYNYPHPLYIRLGQRIEERQAIGRPSRFTIGKGIVIEDGRGLAIISSGDMLHRAKNSCRLLRKRGLKPTLVSMHTLKPLDARLIKELGRTHSSIFTVEEHSLVGGLGSAAAEVLCEIGYAGIFHRIGLPAIDLAHEKGGAEHLSRHYGLSPERVVSTILRRLKRGDGNAQIHRLNGRASTRRG